MSAPNMIMPIDYEQGSNGIGKPIYADKNRVSVRFSKVLSPDLGEMMRTGEECFKEQLLLTKKVKGDSNSPTERVTELHKRLYSKEWQEFQKRENGLGGDPVSKLYGLNGQDMAYLVAMGVMTIQDILTTDRSIIDSMPKGDEVLVLAEVWCKAREKELEAKNALVLLEDLKKENEELKAKLAKAAKPKQTRKRRVIPKEE